VQLWMELVKERDHRNGVCTPDEVEEETAWCQNAKCIMLDAMAKQIRLCTKSKRL